MYDIFPNIAASKINAKGDKQKRIFQRVAFMIQLEIYAKGDRKQNRSETFSVRLKAKNFKQCFHVD
jgi:hypothetical protein